MATSDELQNRANALRAKQLRAKALEVDVKPEVPADVPFLQKAGKAVKDFGVGALKSGALESAGMLGGGALGGLLGAAGGGIGAIPGAVSGAGLGAAGMKSLEDTILAAIDEGPKRSFLDQALEATRAAGRGMAGEVAGQGIGNILSSIGRSVVRPAGKFLSERAAPRVMTSAIKDPELAAEMLKKGEWGTARNMLQKSEIKIENLSKNIEDILGKTDGQIDRLKLVDDLEKLRLQYAKLPGREPELAHIEKIQSMIFQPTSKEAIKRGAVDYSNLNAAEANALKKQIYEENRKLYSGGNYDPASIRAQTDMSIARGLKKGIEEKAPGVEDINKELGYNLQLRDTLEALTGKAEKANLVQLRPLLSGLGLIGTGAIPAAAAPIGMAALGSTGATTGLAQLLGIIGKNLSTKTGAPLTEAATKILTQKSME